MSGLKQGEPDHPIPGPARPKAVDAATASDDAVPATGVMALAKDLDDVVAGQLAVLAAVLVFC